MTLRDKSGRFQHGEGIAINPVLRFWPKVNKTPTCWLWVGAISSTGYGQFHLSGSCERRNRKTVKAHRFSYELVNGPIPPGMLIDHLCHVPVCVNPDHLSLATHSENAINRQRHCSTCTCDFTWRNREEAKKLGVA